MNFRAEFEPSVVRVTAAGDDLQRLVGVLERQWTFTDGYARDARATSRNGFVWSEEFNRSDAELLVVALDNEGWPEAARVTRRAVKLLLAWQLETHAEQLRAEAQALLEETAA